MADIIVAGNTSGAITISAPLVAGSGVLTLPTGTDTLIGKATTDTLTNKTLTAPTITGATITVAATAAPAFSASQSATQSIATGTFTKIQFNFEDFDTNSNYDNATNYRFTPTVAGYYQINAQTRDATGAASGVLYCSIYKNGSAYKQSSGPVAVAGLSINVSVIINFNGSTDYVEVYAFQNSGSAMLIGADATTYFNGAMVRSA
jgi:hypothetical protein